MHLVFVCLSAPNRMCVDLFPCSMTGVGWAGKSLSSKPIVAAWLSVTMSPSTYLNDDVYLSRKEKSVGGSHPMLRSCMLCS